MTEPYIVNGVVMRPVLYLAAPARVDGIVPVRGDQLADEIAAAGFTNVTVAVDVDRIAVQVDGLTDAMAPATARAACASFDEVVALNEAQAATAAAANATTATAIAAVIAAHVPNWGTP